MLYFYHINILIKERKYILIYSYLNRENYQLITEESKKNDIPSIVSTGYPAGRSTVGQWTLSSESR